MRIAVLGASGRIGREVVDVLENQGHEIAELTRAAGVDAYSGAGLSAALSGADVVVDATNASTIETAAVQDFFRTIARNVQHAAAAAGARRIVLVSIIGIEAFPAGHYAGKLAHERAYREGPLPVRILRAAQFHEFTEMMLDWTTRGDAAYVPATRTQLVAARTVAEELARLAVADTALELTEIAGPDELNLAAATARLAARRGAPARVHEVTDTDDPNCEAQAAGALLPGPGAIIAGPTFSEWLDQRYPANR
ncbi:SDR family oxidoreductase [Nocardia cyriacigeorgica]|uniref:NADH-flavin reductase n=1 Tax=Nocardia cyriacigeorgica TaxID=135487 RepID=A0A4U8W619_9NOCA|nr:NAD(P)H-binding protein [Nocardia cyriacigeorgica]MBF6518508.1 NAD(P)H-binding protein [Nocardia cyriacigeorgica]VFB00005.1 Putative NADH-flavin reductase [Nocardia cyriacigeorgica]